MGGIDWIALRRGPGAGRSLRVALRCGDAALRGSHGEVCSRGDLDSERIFGPDVGSSCPCGATTGAVAAPPVQCPRCGLRTTVDPRTERFGHIALAAPVLHPWLLDVHPSPVARVLGITQSQLLAVCGGEAHVVTAASPGAIPVGALVTAARARRACARDAALRTATFAPALQALWSALDRGALERSTPGSRGARVRALERARWLRRLQPWPASILLTHIAVAPPGLRGPDRAALDARYARVLAANARARQDSCRAAQRDLWLAVRALFLGGERLPHGRRASLRRTLRAALRARRDAGEDLSAAATLCPDPRLTLGECALPEALAAECFALRVARALIDDGRADSLAAARRMLARRHPDALDALDRVARAQPVYVVSATLHAPSGLRAFALTLCDGTAVRVHPAHCAALGGAGARVTVRVPASARSRREAFGLTRTHRAAPLDAHLAGTDAAPTLEARLGLYYATFARTDPPFDRPARAFPSLAAVAAAHARGEVHVHDVVTVRLEADRAAAPREAPERHFSTRVTTTVGRALVGAALPPGVPYRYVDRMMLPRTLEELFRAVGESSPPGVTTAMSEQLWSLGLELATRAGLSLGADDLRASPDQAALLADARAARDAIIDDYFEGRITEAEQSNQLINVWSETQSRALWSWRGQFGPAGGDAAMLPDDQLRVWHPLHAQLDAAAGATPDQVATLVAIPALCARASGEVVETAIEHSVAQGVTPLEFRALLLSAHSRALRRDARDERALGIQRRLARALAALRVTEDDCGTTDGRPVRALRHRGRDLVWLRWLGAGRVLSRAARDVPTGTVQCAAGALLDASSAHQLALDGVDVLEVRSPTTCAATSGVCGRCLGRPAGYAGHHAGLDTAFALGAALATVARPYLPSLPLVAGQRLERAARPGRLAYHGVTARRDASSAGHVVLRSGGHVAIVRDDGRTERHGVHAGDEVCGADGAAVAEGELVVRRGAFAVVDGEVVTNRPVPEWQPPERDWRERGLDSLEDLLEARPWSAGRLAALAAVDGVLRIAPDGRAFELRDAAGAVLSRAGLAADDPSHPRTFERADGDWVAAGEAIVAGATDPHALLAAVGPERFASMLADQLIADSASAWPPVAPAHLELVARAMLSRACVLDPGDSGLPAWTSLSRGEIARANASAAARGARPAGYRVLLTGITELGRLQRADALRGVAAPEDPPGAS